MRREGDGRSWRSGRTWRSRGRHGRRSARRRRGRCGSASRRGAVRDPGVCSAAGPSGGHERRLVGGRSTEPRWRGLRAGQRRRPRSAVAACAVLAATTMRSYRSSDSRSRAARGGRPPRPDALVDGDAGSRRPMLDRLLQLEGPPPVARASEPPERATSAPARDRPRRGWRARPWRCAGRHRGPRSTAGCRRTGRGYAGSAGLVARWRRTMSSATAAPTPERDEDDGGDSDSWRLAIRAVGDDPDVDHGSARKRRFDQRLREAPQPAAWRGSPANST